MQSRDTNIDLLISFDRRILSLVKKGNQYEALLTAEEAYRFAETAFGKEHPETAAALNNLGWVQDLMGQTGQAKASYRKALKIKEQHFGPQSVELIPTLENLADLYTSNLNYTKAIDVLKTLINLVENKDGELRIRKSVYACHLASIYELFGSLKVSESIYLDTLSFLEANFGIEHPNTGRVLALLGRLLEKSGDLKRAEYYYDRAWKTLKKNLSRKHPDIGFVRDGLQNIHSKLERLQKP